MKNNMNKEILNMYIDSINNSFGNQSVISGFCNTLICSSNASDSEKVITVPNGYTNTDAYVTIRVLFLNGYYDTNQISNPMTLTVQHEDGTYFDGTSTPTSYPIKSYQNGVLDNLKIHEITQTDYRVIDPNTCIELYFDGSQFVVVGNPLVLSSSDYSIYANGKLSDALENYSTEETLTGGKWIDGKPIYRKVILNPTINTTLLTGVDEVVDYRVKRQCYRGDSLGYVYFDGDPSDGVRTTIYINLANNEVKFNTIHKGLFFMAQWVILEYTKVAD